MLKEFFFLSVVMIIFIISVKSADDFRQFKVGEEVIFKEKSYRIVKVIYESKLSSVYAALEKSSNNLFVIKQGILKHESSLLGLVQRRYNQYLRPQLRMRLANTGIPYAVQRIGTSTKEATLILPHYGMTLKDLNIMMKSKYPDKKHLYSVHTLCTLLNKMITIAEMLHSINIIHNDLKPLNIMVGMFGDRTSYNKIVFIDLDGAADLTNRKHKSRRFTAKYARPEQIISKEKSVQNDFFSIIIIAMELAGVPPSWFEYPSLQKTDPKEFIYRKTHPGLLNEARKQLFSKSNRNDKYLKMFLPIVIEMLSKLKHMKDEITAEPLQDVLAEKCPSRSRVNFEWREEFQLEMDRQRREFNKSRF